MKTIYTLLILLFSFTSIGLTACGDRDGSSDPSCGSYNGKTLYQGPKGGCYYYNSNGNKEYVARSLCNC